MRNIALYSLLLVNHQLTYFVTGDQASRDYIASFFHSLATAGAESTERFGEMADEAATPGGLNEQVHCALQGNGGYELVANQMDAIFKRLSGTDPVPRATRS